MLFPMLQKFYLIEIVKCRKKSRESPFTDYIPYISVLSVQNKSTDGAARSMVALTVDPSIAQKGQQHIITVG